MQCSFDWWPACRLSTFLIPWGSDLGADSCVPCPLTPSRFVEENKSSKNWLPLEYTACPHLCCLDQHRSSVNEEEPSRCTRFAFYQLNSPAPPTLPHYHGAVTTATRWTVSCQCLCCNKANFYACFKDGLLLLLNLKFFALHNCLRLATFHTQEKPTLARFGLFLAFSHPCLTPCMSDQSNVGYLV